MKTKQKFAEMGSNIVYVKEIETTDLPEDLRAAVSYTHLTLPTTPYV